MNRLKPVRPHVLRIVAPLVAALVTVPSNAPAQAPDAVRDELLAHFEMSMRKFIALAEAMPAEKYTWSPGDGVMEVGHVYMHVARYNYLYPSQNMGAALPAGMELDGMEAERDKAEVLRALEQSWAWVRDFAGGLSAADLADETQLYGRSVEKWAVLVQLVSHMNEHLGQSIAYARMNGIAPPWSR